MRCLFWLFLPPWLGWVFVAFYNTQDTNTHTHRYKASHTFCTCSCFGSVSVFVSDFTSRAWEVLWSRKKTCNHSERERSLSFKGNFDSYFASFFSTLLLLDFLLLLVRFCDAWISFRIIFLVFFGILAFGFGLEPLWKGHCYNYGNSHCGFSLSCLCVCGFLGQRNFWFPHEWREGSVRGETGLQQSKPQYLMISRVKNVRKTHHFSPNI